MSFELYVRYILEKKFGDVTKGRHFVTHTAPFFDDISDDQGQVLLDHVCRLENLPRDFAFVAEKLKSPGMTLPTDNASRDNRNYRQYFNRYTRDAIERLYRRDIEYFGYTF